MAPNLLSLVTGAVMMGCGARMPQVEATKFTELGFVGRDVDEIVKDLMEASFTLTKTRLAAQLRAAALAVVEEMLVTALVGPHAGQETFSTFRCGTLTNCPQDVVVQYWIPFMTHNAQNSSCNRDQMTMYRPCMLDCAR